MTQDTMSVMADAEIRAKTFLSHVMGEKIYDKFTKDGKIEIKSGKYRYLLDKDGNVLNKTTMQNYCITTDSSFYPLSDTIAIKYCWIKYKSYIVEIIAHKRHLGYDERRDIEKGLSDKIDNIITHCISNDIIFITLVSIVIMSFALLIYVIIRVVA